MPKRKRVSRTYWRERGGALRAYADFRDYTDVGGGREALKAQGEKLATTDPDVATKLAAARLQELEDRRRNRAFLGIEREAGLAEFAAHHLEQKAEAGRVTEAELVKIEQRLRRAVAFFGAGRELRSIGVRDVERWTAQLARLPGRKREKMSGGSMRHHLNALSNLYRRAQAEAVVPPGYNPAGAMMDKPSAAMEEARWLEVHDAALLLEASRLHRPERDDEIPALDALLATFLLTGGRKAEVLGLELDDVSFDRRIVTFRPNRWRRLKTRTSHRSVPLWPQLEEVLREYVFGGDAPRSAGLLFPSARTGKMVQDLRKAIDAAAERAGWKRGEITSKMLRHTYCSARLQTLDRGAPVSPWTVGKELGHGGMALVNRVYGHLGEIRHRADVVEFRADQHREVLGERLAAVRAWQPRRCEGRSTAGEPCRVRVNLSDDGLCLWHDPARRAEARKARPHARR